MTGKLEGRRILLTGASRGVGLASAKLLLENGALVFGIARDPRRLREVTTELSAAYEGRFSSLSVDLGVPAAANTLRKSVEKSWGALDILIQNAGVMLHHEGGIMEEPEGILEKSLDLNLMAPHRLTRALLPLLKQGQQPRLINVGSGAGTHEGMTEPGISSYRLSKWALHGLTMLQARDLEGSVNVQAFDPGWVRTDLGGPNAPGSAEEAAAGLLKTLLIPWEEKCAFNKDGEVIPW